MPIKKIELSFHPSNPLNEIIADVNENFDAIVASFDTLNSGQGVVGPRGERGEKGEAGVNGVEGMPGATGERGERGEQGIQGEQGPAGKDGKDGINGINGADGLPGVPGKDGAAGVQGLRGERGLQGEQGPVGAPGATGAAGSQGVAGPAGIQGPVGLTGPIGAPGAMNYKIHAPASPTNGITVTGQTITSTTFTSTGNPVLIMVTGDANPANPGYVILQIFRDGNAIGRKIQAEQLTANVNVPYCVQVVDTPSAGTYTYSMRTVGAILGSWNFGEQDAPTMTIVELTGATGPTGPGINNTVVQNSITLGATTTAPTASTRTVQRIESQTVGDKVRLTYKFGQVSTPQGSGDYLFTLPAGMSFNSTYNPAYTGALWQGGVNPMAPYFIATSGGIVCDANWTNQIMVVPYDSTRFRLAVTNNVNQTGYGFWSSGFYATSAGSGLSVQLQFEIWK